MMIEIQASQVCFNLCLMRLLTKTKKLLPLVKYALPPCCCCCPQPHWGQNFVDKLEQRVKETFQENEIRELKQPRRRRQQKPHKFAYLTMKNSVFASFARAFFIF